MNADIFLLALCVWREARDEHQLSWIAIAWAMKNRMTRQKRTLYSTVMGRWMLNNRIKPSVAVCADLWPVESDSLWIGIQAECAGVWTGIIPDPTGGASSFYPKYTHIPTAWMDDEFIETAKIGKHIFFKERD